jgi:hypothetical protein
VTSARFAVFYVLGPLLGFSWLLLAVFNPEYFRGKAEYPAIGYILGTLFGQAALASAWTALGPLWLPIRLPLSLAWIGLLWLAAMINLSHGPGGLGMAVLLGACLIGQWLLVQLPFWGLALFYGLRLSHPADATPPATRRQRQFGIRQLLVLTAVVAILLGAGRALVLALAQRVGSDVSRESPVFIFLAAVAIGMTIPLLLAALLPRWSLIAVPAMLVLVAGATVRELQLLTLVQGPGGGPNQWHLTWINFFTVGWVLFVVLVLRLGGYRLASAGES